MTMPNSKASILIVENDAIVAEDIASRLRMLGYGVCGTIDRGERVSAAVVEKCPDLVLMDLMLSGVMDGFGATEAIRVHRDLPIIFLTGHAESDIHRRALEANPLAFLFKPIQTAQLAIQIEIALQRHAMKRRLRESVSLLEATIESTADGLLVVDLHGHVLLHNRQFLAIWGIPTPVCATDEESRLLDFVLPKLENPEAFLSQVRALYRTPDRESLDLLRLKDGRTLERFSRPQLVGDQIHGRVWSFRDVTLQARAQQCLEHFNDRLELLVKTRTADLEAANDGLLREAARRRKLEKQILSIGEAQQQRLGRDLHDGICQELAGINFSLEATVKKMSRRSPALPRLQTIAQNVRATMLNTRLLSRGLAPAALESGNLASALADLTANSTALFDLSCPFECDREGLDDIDRDLAINLYRIGQEALQNACKHGRASEVKVTLRKLDDGIHLVIEDNGRGLPETPPVNGLTGMGLRIMQHRAAVHGGRLEIFSSPGAGVRVECQIPL